MSAVAERVATYAERRRRAAELAQRFDFAREPLMLYGAVAEAQERVFDRARAERPSVDGLAAYVVRVGLPEVMGAVMSAGTETLREAVLLRFHEGDLERMVRSWLRGEAQSGTDTFLARAAASPVLEALPDVARALPIAGEERFCPECGGPPQVSVFVDSGEALVTGQRRLVCARCANEWVYPRMTCVACGTTESSKLVVLADPEQLPHLRIDACERCKRYIVSIDARLEGRAVPVVDELAAIPLDMAAAERGFTKVTSNLMGF
ncbi:MAG TPA: formate dehydrogenase accessory protein FdhE [Candidatus Limnocylindria bacterium]|nr:formate dehydrogenase accessory protein FdhE [Candidatus Limnocylindria bacterium]